MVQLTVAVAVAVTDMVGTVTTITDYRTQDCVLRTARAVNSQTDIHSKLTASGVGCPSNSQMCLT